MLAVHSTGSPIRVAFCGSSARNQSRTAFVEKSNCSSLDDIGVGGPAFDGLDVVLEQRQPGRDAVVVRASGPILFLPSALDVRLPFEITVQFAPGTYQMFEHVSVLVTK